MPLWAQGGYMGLFTEMLAVAVVWLSSVALCPFGVNVENRVCPRAKSASVKSVARWPRGAPITIIAPDKMADPTPRDACTRA